MCLRLARYRRKPDAARNWPKWWASSPCRPRPACLDPGRETIPARALLPAEAWYSTVAFLGPGDLSYAIWKRGADLSEQPQARLPSSTWHRPADVGKHAVVSP